MPIHSYPITSREQWLNMRTGDVTASAAGALLGVHEYITPYSLWALKSGKVQEDVETSPAMERGLLLEPVAFKLYQRQRPNIAIEWNGTPGELGGVYLRDTEAHLGATVDCYARDERGEGVVQFKTVESGIFKRKWLHRDDRDPSATPEMQAPLWIAVQAIVEADLRKAAWAEVAVMVIGYGIDLHVLDIPIHAGILGRVRELCADFWRRVRENDPPPPDFGKDGATIAALYKTDNGQTIDLRGDNVLPGLLEERQQLTDKRKMVETRLDQIKAELQFKIGANESALAQGWTISNKMQHRTEHMVKASSFRVLRTKRTP